VRYTRIGWASYGVGGLLLAVALLVAWARSTPAPAPAHPAAAAPGATAAAPPGPGATALGAAVYAAECRSCHGQGERRGGAIPPLRGYTVELFRADGGRDYLIDFLFDGRVRRLEEGRLVYEKAHPIYTHLSDEAAAALLDHLLRSWGNESLLPAGTPPYQPAEVAAHRPSP
jgi:cytochrome c5